MDTPPSSPIVSPQTLFELAKTVASGGLGSFFTWLMMRKKLKPEIQVLDATAAKTYAEARHIDGETLNDAYKRIEELYIIADGQRTQISRLQRDNDKLILNEDFLDEELKWLKAVLVAAGVKLENYGHMRQTAAPRPPMNDPGSTK